MTAITLEGKVAIVTGASRGIGRAIAESFAAHGARVALCARKPDALAAVAAAIEAKGGQALALPAHVGKPEDVRALLAQAVERFGKVDVLVNNAGTNPYFGRMVDTPEGPWRKTFEVNLDGAFALVQALAAHLAARKAPGAIVNVASVAGLRAAPMQGVYGATKAAMIAMTKTLAYELGPLGIRVNAIAPGLIETRLSSAIVGNDALRAQVVSRTPLWRHGQPEEIAGGALFLASDAASFVTGHTLVMDGGFTIT